MAPATASNAVSRSISSGLSRRVRDVIPIEELTGPMKESNLKAAASGHGPVFDDAYAVNH